MFIKYKLHAVYSLLLFNFNVPTYYAEVFTALTELEKILGSHYRVITDLESYVGMQERKLSLLNRYLDLYGREHKKAMEDIFSYVRNPINAFILAKRLVVDLDHIHVIIKTGAEQIPHLLLKQNNAYPDKADLIGAAQAINRLQKTYKLDIKDLANGNLNNIAYTTPMTAGDCFELGHALMFDSKDFKSGQAWMIEADRKYNEENVSYPFTEVEINKYISLANAMSGDTKTTLPSSSDSGAQPLQTFINEEPKFEHAIEQAELKTYEALCRGDLVVPRKISKRLKCSYLTKNHPFLILAPYKIEMMYLDPDLILFHDVMSDREIESITQMAKPELIRAQINHPEKGYLTSAKYRISKIAWLMDNNSDILARIARRIAHMTGLIMDATNQSQVVNYGIGGQYEPHYDFFRKEDKHVTMDNNRIATILFYMSDVAQGGATVFPELGVRLRPVKGTAAFWFNLHPSGTCNLAMRHAACPVLQGEKWVCSRFIHRQSQLFIRPCTLEYQEQGFIRKIPRPESKTNS